MPHKRPFHDVVIVILMSQMAVSEVVVNVGNVVYPFKMVTRSTFLGKMTTSNGFYDLNRHFLEK